MDTFDRVFQTFITYAGPFLLLWWCYDWISERPRTKKTIFWAIFTGAWGLYGLFNLGRIVVKALG